MSVKTSSSSAFYLCWNGGKNRWGCWECDTQAGSGALYRILSSCTATSPFFWLLFCKHAHLSAANISEVFVHVFAALILMTFCYPWDMPVQQLVYRQWVLIQHLIQCKVLCCNSTSGGWGMILWKIMLTGDSRRSCCLDHIGYIKEKNADVCDLKFNCRHKN